MLPWTPDQPYQPPQNILTSFQIQYDPEVLNLKNQIEKKHQKFLITYQLLQDQQKRQCEQNIRPQQISDFYPWVFETKSPCEILTHLGPLVDQMHIHNQQKVELIQNFHYTNYIDQLQFNRNQLQRPNQNMQPMVEIFEQPPLPRQRTRTRRPRDQILAPINGFDIIQSKNIPKNFAKAIIIFCQKNVENCQKILGEQFKYEDFKKYLLQNKNRIFNLQDFIQLLTDRVEDPTQQAYNRTFRRMSYFFFRKQAISYVFNSRIKFANKHLSFRRRMMKLIENLGND